MDGRIAAARPVVASAGFAQRSTATAECGAIATLCWPSDAKAPSVSYSCGYDGACGARIPRKQASMMPKDNRIAQMTTSCYTIDENDPAPLIKRSNGWGPPRRIVAPPMLARIGIAHDVSVLGIGVQRPAGGLRDVPEVT